MSSACCSVEYCFLRCRLIHKFCRRLCEIGLPWKLDVTYSVSNVQFIRFQPNLHTTNKWGCCHTSTRKVCDVLPLASKIKSFIHACPCIGGSATLRHTLWWPRAVIYKNLIHRNAIDHCLYKHVLVFSSALVYMMMVGSGTLALIDLCGSTRAPLQKKAGTQNSN